MQQDLLHTNSLSIFKDQFFNDLDVFLTGMGFSKTDNSYKLTTHLQQPDTQLIINGQMIIQPGKQTLIECLLELFGEGRVEHLGSDREPDEFELVLFEIRTDGNLRMSHMEGIYHDIEYFKQLTYQFFQL